MNDLRKQRRQVLEQVGVKISQMKLAENEMTRANDAYKAAALRFAELDKEVRRLTEEFDALCGKEEL